MNNQLFQNSPINITVSDPSIGLINHAFNNSTLLSNLNNQFPVNAQQSTNYPDRTKLKGPLSAFNCFVQVIKEEHRRKHPQETVILSEFSKKCAEKWKQMTSKERKRFEDLATMDKERYQRDVSEFASNPATPLFGVLSSGTDGLRRRKRKRTKDPGMPKRAWSAFFFFSHELRPSIREEHPEWRVSEIAKELGKRWDECKDKAKYEAQAQADRQRYEEEMVQYKNGNYVPSVGRHKFSVETTNVVGPVGDEFFDEEEETDDVEEIMINETPNPITSLNSNPSQNTPVSDQKDFDLRKTSFNFDARSLANPNSQSLDAKKD